jgi:hypothetical protein
VIEQTLFRKGKTRFSLLVVRRNGEGSSDLIGFAIVILICWNAMHLPKDAGGASLNVS